MIMIPRDHITCQPERHVFVLTPITCLCGKETTGPREAGGGMLDLIKTQQREIADLRAQVARLREALERRASCHAPVIHEFGGHCHYCEPALAETDGPRDQQAVDDYIHICDLDDMIDRLVALKNKALRHFGTWPQ